jgi:hypothetical protein
LRYFGVVDIIRCGQKHQGKPPLLAIVSSHLDKAQVTDKELECFIEIAGPDHGVQVAH